MTFQISFLIEMYEEGRSFLLGHEKYFLKGPYSIFAAEIEMTKF